MYLRRVHIQNVRSIAALTWELPPDVDGPGWHVILGDNGAGKSSFLRSIALALVGPMAAAGLRQSWISTLVSCPALTMMSLVRSSLRSASTVNMP